MLLAPVIVEVCENSGRLSGIGTSEKSSWDTALMVNASEARNISVCEVFDMEQQLAMEKGGRG